MASTNQKITFQGEPLVVNGKALEVGAILPAVTLTGTDMSDITLDSFRGKVLIVSSVPSLDTPVCSVQTKRFNEEVSKLSDDVVVLTVSRDLPFAQARWCGAEGVEAVVCASDFKYRTFGKAFGTDLETLGLLARAVFVANQDGTLVYVDYVPEIAEEPDYEAVMGKVSALLE
ncbi:thiol peroxidase [Acaryochloris sp. CCMEE 5410]|uniref:thiol peroxidase n=1 Tax=Acaryochloris sp. CCMEE 5410 TaxID=310037 RepID=UPI0002484260|nr:thiol peroxidase [Acaryochloris sp. CCMEE 5410]KAI9129075.1 thiol peroxidase [Acaryochloris sp. CCMEE 5410]